MIDQHLQSHLGANAQLAEALDRGEIVQIPAPDYSKIKRASSAIVAWRETLPTPQHAQNSELTKTFEMLRK